MISSPCVKCDKKNQPKEKCAKNCEILNVIQDYLVSIEEGCVSPAIAIDYAEEWRFCVNTRDIKYQK